MSQWHRNVTVIHGHEFASWRRPLRDGSQLVVTREPGGPDAEPQPLVWVWRHKAGRHPVLGTVTKAHGRAKSADAAMAAADRHAATLTHLSQQQAMEI